MKLLFSILIILMAATNITAQKDKVYTDLKKAFEAPDQVYQLHLSYSKEFNIPDSITQFQNLTHLTISSNSVKKNGYNRNGDLDSIPFDLALFKKLEYLDLGDNDLKNAPHSLPKSLKVITLYNNKIKSIPSTLCSLHKLEILNLSQNDSLVTLPKEFTKLKKLKKLLLNSCSQLKNAPNLAALKSLKTLEIAATRIDSIIPSFVFTIPNLKELNLNRNHLKKIPAEIKQLSKLETLKLSNQDKYLYNSIFRIKNIANLQYLPKLKNLYLRGNKLEQVPSVIGKLKNLVILDLSFNNITNIPDELLISTRLEYLFLNKNKLEKLPTSIALLSKLKNMNLEKNKLKKLPHNLGKLKKMKTLHLQYNNFGDSLPTVITELENLEKLYLSHSQIYPSNITNLKKLKVLDIKKTEGHLPSSILGLKSLEVLDLSKNNLTQLSSKINQLSNLKELLLEKNKLKKIPSSIYELRKLRKLDLGINYIKKIPFGIHQLSNLEYLDLCFNPITELPDSMQFLSKLEYLDLSFADLKELPDLPLSLKLLDLRYNDLQCYPFLQKYTNLEYSNIHGNYFYQEKRDKKMNFHYSIDTFIDTRDSNTYPTVQIYNQTWMAENLRYNSPNSIPNPDSIIKAGHLYTPSDALKACPDGWHWTTDRDWNVLFAEIMKDFPNDPDKKDNYYAMDYRQRFRPRMREEPDIWFDLDNYNKKYNKGSGYLAHRSMTASPNGRTNFYSLSIIAIATDKSRKPRKTHWSVLGINALKENYFSRYLFIGSSTSVERETIKYKEGETKKFPIRCIKD